MIDYAGFLNDPQSPAVLLAEFTVYSGGGTVTRYVATEGYMSGPSDSPASQFYDGRIADDTEFEKTMGAAFGVRGSPANGGELALINDDGALDDWINDVFYGYEITFWYGNPSWSLTDIKSNGRRYKGLMRDINADDQFFRVTFQSSKHLILDNSPIQAAYETTGTVIGDLRPLCYGYPKNIEGVIVDPDTSPEYRIHEFGPVEDPAVTYYIDQEETTSPTITKFASASIRQVEFASEPAGLVTFDAKGVKDDGTWIDHLGAALKHMLTRTLPNSIFLAESGTSSTLVLPDSASDVDDEYNGLTVYKTRFSEDGSGTRDSQTISDYVGDTRTMTISSTWSQTPEEGDGVEIESYAMQAGPIDDITELDEQAFDELDVDWDYEIGIYIDNDQSMLDVLDETLSPGAFYGLGVDDKLTVGLVKDPSTEPIQHRLGTNDLWGDIEIDRDIPRIYRLLVGYDRNFTPQRGASAGDVSPSRASFATKEYRYHIKEDRTILDSDPGARVMRIKTPFTGGAAARAERDRLWNLFSVNRSRYTVRAFTKPFQYNLGDIVELTDSRYGLSAGKRLLVQQIIEMPVSGRSELVLWG